MFKILRIIEPNLEVSKLRLEQVDEIFRETFVFMPDYARRIPKFLADNPKNKFESVLLISEDMPNHVTGFSFFFYFP